MNKLLLIVLSFVILMSTGAGNPTNAPHHYRDTNYNYSEFRYTTPKSIADSIPESKAKTYDLINNYNRAGIKTEIIKDTPDELIYAMYTLGGVNGVLTEGATITVIRYSYTKNGDLITDVHTQEDRWDGDEMSVEGIAGQSARNAVINAGSNARTYYNIGR